MLGSGFPTMRERGNLLACQPECAQTELRARKQDSSFCPWARPSSSSSISERPFDANAIGRAPGTQPLHCRSGREHVGVGVAPADQLHADRQAAAQAGGDGCGGVAAEICQIGQAPADQRVHLGAVDAGRPLGVPVGGNALPPPLRCARRYARLRRIIPGLSDFQCCRVGAPARARRRAQSGRRSAGKEARS